jgi:hypothetical protein
MTNEAPSRMTNEAPTPNYVAAQRAISELHKWIHDDQAVAEFEANTDPELVKRIYYSIATNYELETNALKVRLRAERGYWKLLRQFIRQPAGAPLNIRRRV